MALKKVYIDLDENNRVNSISFTITPESLYDVELEVEEGHEVLYRPFSFIYIDGELVKDNEGILSNAKKKKDIELNTACNQSILNGFYHMINGVKYHFSYDEQAQVNFGDAREILNDGVVDSMDWTVSTGDGYERIKVKKEDMDGLTISIFVHKQENIGRYRDVLLPLVREAKTIEEVNNVTWDYEEEN